MDLSNVYFVIGTSYAGKSTIVKNLARKHGGIALEENYHDAKLPELDSREFPGLTYTRDLQDWHEFIRRTPDEYVTWLENTKKECEIVELQIIEELLEKPEAQGKKIFVDTNICIETLHRISDRRHVLVMLADPEIGINRFFDRPDPEKQFLYRLMLEEPDPQAALDNYREILTRICSKESYDELLHSGFEVIFRDENRSQEETVLLAEKIFGISSGMKIELTELSEENMEQCFALRVAENQTQYIASNEDSLKTAKENRKVARPFVICCDGRIVGFTMFAFDEDYEDPDDRYWLWRFMIDEGSQGKGYGTAALQVIIRYFREHGANNIRLSTKETNTKALSMYHRAGFRETGELNDEEIVLQLDLRGNDENEL